MALAALIISIIALTVGPGFFLHAYRLVKYVRLYKTCGTDGGREEAWRLICKLGREPNGWAERSIRRYNQMYGVDMPRVGSTRIEIY